MLKKIIVILIFSMSHVCRAMEQDIDELRPYYQAICKIQAILEQTAKKFSCPLCIDAWPQHDVCFYRTPKYLFLGTSILDKEKERLCILYTPFGRVKLLDVGWNSRLLGTTQMFLTNCDLELEEVTNRVLFFNYDQSLNVTRGPVICSGSGGQSKFYLIKSVGSIDISPKRTDKLIIFDYCRLDSEQEDKDGKQFAELSQSQMVK